MKITLVKKVLLSGAPCRKCIDVLNHLENNDLMTHIDDVLIAEERNPDSPGMILAKTLNVDRAPFFVVEDGDQTKVYTVCMKFVKEVLEQ